MAKPIMRFGFYYAVAVKASGRILLKHGTWADAHAAIKRMKRTDLQIIHVRHLVVDGAEARAPVRLKPVTEFAF